MDTIPGLGYTFRNPELLTVALTHKSYRNGDRSSGNNNNERMEFLGDAFFDAAVGEALYHRLPDVTEGVLTRKRAEIVCEASLADLARRLHLGTYLQLSPGEEKQGGRERTSILSDAMEAVIGAVYLDSDWPTVRETILRLFAECIEQIATEEDERDAKTALQEKLQKNGAVEIRYRVDRESGPDHSKTFWVSVTADGETLGSGQGKSKQEAGEAAARAALQKIIKN